MLLLQNILSILVNLCNKLPFLSAGGGSIDYSPPRLSGRVRKFFLRALISWVKYKLDVYNIHPSEELAFGEGKGSRT